METGSLEMTEYAAHIAVTFEIRGSVRVLSWQETRTLISGFDEAKRAKGGLRTDSPKILTLSASSFMS
jgi:hypothetical protein